MESCRNGRAITSLYSRGRQELSGSGRGQWLAVKVKGCSCPGFCDLASPSANKEGARGWQGRDGEAGQHARSPLDQGTGTALTTDMRADWPMPTSLPKFSAIAAVVPAARSP